VTVDVHIIKENVFNQITTVQFLVSTNRTKINENISLNRNLGITEIRDIEKNEKRLTKFRCKINGEYTNKELPETVYDVIHC